MKKQKFFLRKWYFWLIVIIDWILFTPKEAKGFMGYSASFVGAFIVVFFVFFVVWGIIKGFRKIKKN